MPGRIRRFLHIAAAEALYYTGTLALLRWYRRTVLGRDEVCVVGLHRVLTPDEQERSNSLEGMVIRESTYLALLAYLQTRFRVIGLDDLANASGRKSGSTESWCVITFDDGWEDTYSRAFPGLKKYGLPAVVFLATDAIGTTGGFWVERVKHAWRVPAARERMKSAVQAIAAAMVTGSGDLEDLVEWLKRMPSAKRDAILEHVFPGGGNGDNGAQVDAMLSWEQALEMSRAGVEIGAHTVSHPLLTYEEPDVVERELKVSKQVLEEKLGKQVRAFAYPNGDWNEQVRKKVEDAGYQWAFTTHPGWHGARENSRTISRLLLHEGNITTRDGEFSPAMLNLTLEGWA